MSDMRLGPRQQRVLRAVVHEYIRTAQPVASETIVRRYRLGVSSATVRNDLAALEDLGLLTHPHTSAGRVPTSRGYRYFISSLMGDAGLLQSEQMMVRHQFHQVQLDTSEWLRLAASVLARLSTGAALVTEPHHEQARIRHLEVVPIQDRRALLIVVFVGGVMNLLRLPEFASSEPLRDVIAILEDRTRLARLLPAALPAGEVSVAIGDEVPLRELREFSLIFGRYGGRSAGFLGVGGPTRMDYARA